jgi:hypothetical protein
MADSCLVIYRGDVSSDERIIRVAEMVDLTPTALLPLPSTVDRFSAASLIALLPAGMQNGDIIKIYNVPAIWQYFFGETNGGTDYVVTDDTDPFDVVVSPVFPAFGRNLEFTITRGISFVVGGTTRPIDGLANRYYSTAATEYLTADHYDSWDTIDAADNIFAVLRGEAQALVNNLNIDSYTGVLEELYQ